jgi:hypothetical protein
MQVDQNKIIETFERIEEEAGGLWNAMPSMTLDKTAIELDLPREKVRSVMIDHWTQAGAG